MMKLTKTGIGLLTRLYRSVLHKCFLINAGLWQAMGDAVSKAVSVPARLVASLLSGGTMSGEAFNALDEILLSRLFERKLASLTAVGLTIAAATMPNEANADFTGTGSLCYNSSTGAVVFHNVAECATGETRLASFGPFEGMFRKITNVADGVNDNDVATYGQVKNLAPDIGIPQFIRHIDHNSAGQPYYSVDETSYGGMASRGGNFVKAYFDIKNDEYPEDLRYTWHLNVTDIDGIQHHILTGSSYLISTIKDVMKTERWHQDSNGLWYYIGAGYESGFGSNAEHVSEENRDLIIAAFKKSYQDGSLLHTIYYGVDDLIRNDISVVDNISILDEAVGIWHDGNYIKAYRMEDAEKTSLGANLQALDNALYTNYYMKNNKKYKKLDIFRT